MRARKPPVEPSRRGRSARATAVREPADSASVSNRILQILDAVASADRDFGVKDIADKVGLPPSTAHRMLQVLKQHGFIEQTQGRRYRIGLEFYRISTLVVDSLSLVDIARPFMAEVAKATNETCLFGLYHEHDHTLSFVAKVDSPQPIRYRIKMNQPFHIVWGASGRSVLAFLGDAVIREISQHEYFAPNDGRRLDKSELATAIARIRKRSYAMTHGHAWAGSVGIGTPVFGRGDRIVGTLSVTIPEFRFASRDEARIAASIIEQARLLSRALGWNAETSRYNLSDRANRVA